MVLTENNEHNKQTKDEIEHGSFTGHVPSAIFLFLYALYLCRIVKQRWKHPAIS